MLILLFLIISFVTLNEQQFVDIERGFTMYCYTYFEVIKVELINAVV